jgi:hypothetical protein
MQGVYCDDLTVSPQHYLARYLSIKRGMEIAGRVQSIIIDNMSNRSLK